ncbi:MAG: deoxynucleoside kinase [Bacteroidales bacterium]|jgi:deoxyguanosine kinase
MRPSGLKYNFIAIEGNIGAGKTTLARRLAEEYDAKLILERFEDNSFLPKFYQQPDIYAFPLEMSFLADRYQQLKDKLMMQELFKTFTVSDYLIDKSLIFARNNLKVDEFNLYARLFHIISAFLPRPDLLIYLYLDIPHLQKNIRNRGRDYEKLIRPEYLEKIQAGYLNHFRSLTGIPILIIDTNHLDFMDREADYQAFLKAIQQDFDNGIHRIFL